KENKKTGSITAQGRKVIFVLIPSVHPLACSIDLEPAARFACCDAGASGLNHAGCKPVVSCNHLACWQRVNILLINWRWPQYMWGIHIHATLILDFFKSKD
ncbi:MAG: hypothetical protein ACRC7Q_07615, partial [Plesiomonas shigelloides]